MQEHQEIRLSVSLTQSEYRALVEMARAELRHPRLQMRALITAEARRRGLLSDKQESPHEYQKDPSHAS